MHIVLVYALTPRQVQQKTTTIEYKKRNTTKLKKKKRSQYELQKATNMNYRRPLASWSTSSLSQPIPSFVSQGNKW